MKTMTCNQLGGACDLAFHAETFEEIADMSKAHGMEMFEKKDQAHLEAMNKIRTLMTSPDKMEEWYDQKRKEFEKQPSQ
ncbi:MAG: DUF1059 domain-containing protein [Ekhidna sp.]